MLDGTHDPALQSWVVSAGAEGTDFPIQNLPFGRFRPRGATTGWRIGVAIGDEVLDLRAVREQELWGGEAGRWLQPLSEGRLAAFMAMGARARRGLRGLLSEGLREGSELQGDLAACLLAQGDVELGLPCRIGDYTEFDAGTRDAAMPVGHAGRVSSIGVSGQRFHRPQEPRARAVAQCLDWTLEVGVLVGTGNAPGRPMSMAQAEDDWFGMVLLNGWRAQDLPGRLLARSFATTLSPWIVTQEALAPFCVPGAIDLQFDVLLQTAAMRASAVPPRSLAQLTLRDTRWTPPQLLVHHSSNGCNLQPGDLIGCSVGNGGGEGDAAARSFLQDGDTVLLRGRAERPGARRIGFGPCAGTLLSALSS
jgi:fumarylacetoacetase